MSLHGFELGVDEYISKPFSPKILVARVNAILKKKNLGAVGMIRWKQVVLPLTSSTYRED